MTVVNIRTYCSLGKIRREKNFVGRQVRRKLSAQNFLTTKKYSRVCSLLRWKFFTMDFFLMNISNHWFFPNYGIHNTCIHMYDCTHVNDIINMQSQYVAHCTSCVFSAYIHMYKPKNKLKLAAVVFVPSCDGSHVIQWLMLATDFCLVSLLLL